MSGLQREPRLDLKGMQFMGQGNPVLAKNGGRRGCLLTEAPSRLLKNMEASIIWPPSQPTKRGRGLSFPPMTTSGALQSRSH